MDTGREIGRRFTSRSLTQDANSTAVAQPNWSLTVEQRGDPYIYASPTATNWNPIILRWR